MFIGNNINQSHLTVKDGILSNLIMSNSSWLLANNEAKYNSGISTQKTEISITKQYQGQTAKIGNFQKYPLHNDLYMQHLQKMATIVDF